jgi:hypothetical protein
MPHVRMIDLLTMLTPVQFFIRAQLIQKKESFINSVNVIGALYAFLSSGNKGV